MGDRMLLCRPSMMAFEPPSVVIQLVQHHDTGSSEMERESTTLRSLWDGAQENAVHAVEAVRSDSVLDWPIWLALIAGLIAVFVGLSLLGSFIEIVGGVLGGLRRAGRRPSVHPDRVPPEDPAERYLWANREGKYAPKDSGRDRNS